jgi:hypothetical protein
MPLKRTGQPIARLVRRCPPQLAVKAGQCLCDCDGEKTLQAKCRGHKRGSYFPFSPGVKPLKDATITSVEGYIHEAIEDLDLNFLDSALLIDIDQWNAKADPDASWVSP